MFTGFASENSPAIQVWDFFRAFASTSAVRSVALADDCAPIQYFRTGGSTTSINVYLPTAPIDGKIIKICNATYGANNQKLLIFTPDMSFGYTSNSYIVGAGQTLELCYSINCITYSTSALTNTGWIALNNYASSSALNYTAFSLGFNSSAIGTGGMCLGTSNSASGQYSAVFGGSSNTASNQYSAVFGGGSNTASGISATVSGGGSNTANNSYSIVAGGSSNIASGQNSAVLGGISNTASGQYSTVTGGGDNLANASASSVIGGIDGITRSVIGNFVTPASFDPISTQVGTSQVSMLVLGTQTTDATSTVLRSNTSAASTTNQVVLPNNSAYVFQGLVIANVTGAGNTSSWKFEGAIKRGASAGTTALVAAVTPTVIAQDAGAATWVLAITADTTNGGIAVTVTGQAATTIRWVCSIESTEVTY